MKNQPRWLVMVLLGLFTVCTMYSAKGQAQRDALNWVSMRAGQAIPRNLIIAGREVGGIHNGVLTYVCRAPYRGGTWPGKLVDGTCNIGYGGKQIAFTEYEVATGSAVWGFPNKSGYAGALWGGEIRESGPNSQKVTPLYLCRATFSPNGVNRGQHPGKIAYGKCYFGFGGQELRTDNFELLYPNPSSASDGSGQAIDWTTNAVVHKNQTGQSFRYSCPAYNGKLDGPVWGTDVYHIESMICQAAVHAGIISPRSGGTVTIKIGPSPQRYTSSTRNGVTSYSYSGGATSFVFTK
jgi:hypothetical protein